MIYSNGCSYPVVIDWECSTAMLAALWGCYCMLTLAHTHITHSAAVTFVADIWTPQKKYFSQRILIGWLSWLRPKDAACYLLIPHVLFKKNSSTSDVFNTNWFGCELYWNNYITLTSCKQSLDPGRVRLDDNQQRAMCTDVPVSGVSYLFSYSKLLTFQMISVFQLFQSDEEWNRNNRFCYYSGHLMCPSLYLFKIYIYLYIEDNLDSNFIIGALTLPLVATLANIN